MAHRVLSLTIEHCSYPSPGSKACMSQGNIDENLATLPVYLAACSRLLILLGPTYLSRVWCCLELFTWMQMGGGVERVTLLPINAEDSTIRGQLRERSAKFTVQRAQCFKEEERQRLLAIMESAYGDFEQFNLLVRQVITGLIDEALEGDGDNPFVRPRSSAANNALYVV